jgi:hypothetical protein
MEQMKSVHEWGQALERSLEGMDPGQRETLLNTVEATVDSKYAGDRALREWLLRIVGSLRGGGRAFGPGRMR